MVIYTVYFCTYSTCAKVTVVLGGFLNHLGGEDVSCRLGHQISVSVLIFLCVCACVSGCASVCADKTLDLIRANNVI